MSSPVALPYGNAPVASDKWDARVRLYLVGELSIGTDHGQTAESIASHWPDEPVAEVRAALDRLEAAGETWRDASGYRRRTCPPSYNGATVATHSSSSHARFVESVRERPRRGHLLGGTTMSNQTQTADSKKLWKAANERVRKAKAKAATTGEPVEVITLDDAEKFVILSVHPSGETDSTDSPRFDSIDDAKAYLASAAAEEETPEQPAAEPEAAEPEPETVPELSSTLPIAIFAYVCQHGGEITAPRLAQANSDLDAKSARRELTKLVKRGLLSKRDGGVFKDSTGSENAEAAAKSYNALEASENEAKASRPAAAGDGKPRSQGRKLVAKVGGSEVIVRMSERQQAQCVAATGGLPKIGDVEFVRADGTPTSGIAASAAAAGDDE